MHIAALPAFGINDADGMIVVGGVGEDGEPQSFRSYPTCIHGTEPKNVINRSCVSLRCSQDVINLPTMSLVRLTPLNNSGT